MEGLLDEKSEWINTLAVHHIGTKAIGICWCNVHRSSGIGFMAFWGYLPSHRTTHRAIAFVQEVIRQLHAFVPHLRAFVFAAERVDWDVLDRFLDKAVALRMGSLGRKKLEPDWCDKLADPLQGGANAIVRAFDAESSRNRQTLAEHLRWFRRFKLFAQGGRHEKSFERRGFRLLSYVRKSYYQPPVPPDHRIMADFVQPPLRPPAHHRNDSKLWLFSLLLEPQDMEAATAVDWVYDVFFKSFFGEGRTAIPRWNEYMVKFKHRHRDRFVEEAMPHPICLRDLLDRYTVLAREVKNHLVRKQAEKPGANPLSVAL